MKNIIGKYIAVLRIGMANSMEYRLNFILNTVLTLFVGAAVNMYLWEAVYNSTQNLTIGSMHLKEMLIYIACAMLCSRITQTPRSERNAGEEIRSGDLNKYLLKPVSHAVYTIVTSLSERLVSLLFIVILALAVGLPLAHSIGISLSLPGIIFAIPILFCGMLINSLISLTISYMAFWLDEVWTFHVVKDISMWFLSGQLVPMTALPETARFLAGILPFQYLAYVPAGLMIGTIPVTQVPVYFGGAFLWVWILIGTTSLIWHRGIAKFGAFGG